jgi:uncharacterized damage-inducible protein DinB
MFDPESPPLDGDERAVVTWLLDYHRSVLLRKVSGISEEQARSVAASSDLTLLGLVRHLTNVEQYWFAMVFVGSDEPGHYDDPDDVDRDFHPQPGDTLAAALDVFNAEIVRSRRVAAEASSFDVLGQRQRHGSPVNLRWIMVHMVEEYARHCGHADIIRQHIDGVTGD